MSPSSYRGFDFWADPVAFFEDFKQTMKFINDVAKIQTKLDHHGDISFNYDTVKLEIYSHTHNTITTIDIEFAKQVAAKLPKEK